MPDDFALLALIGHVNLSRTSSVVKNESTCFETSSPKSIVIEKKRIVLKEGETVLEALERADVDVNYNCREGFCGVCRTKLITGTVEYHIEPLAFIDDDEILSCCTRPTSDITIKVDY